MEKMYYNSSGYLILPKNEIKSRKRGENKDGKQKNKKQCHHYISNIVGNDSIP